MEAVIFDLDGVLVDSEPAHGRAIRDVCAAEGVDFEIEEAIGLPDDVAMMEAWRRAGRELDAALLPSLLEAKTRRYLRMIEAGETSAFPGAVDLVRSSGERFRIGICSAGLREEVMAQLRRLSLADHVESVVCAEDVSSPKPAPDPYLLAAAQLGVEPPQCVAIEDSITGVASAQAAGCYVIAVEHTTHRAALSGAHVIASSIRELNLGQIGRTSMTAAD